MGNLKFINKVTLLYLSILSIVVIFGYIYFIKPMQTSINEKITELNLIKDNIKNIEAQIPEKINKDFLNNNKDLSTNVFDPYFYGYDLSTGNGFLLDSLLKKVKNTKNKVIEFSFSSDNPSLPGAMPVADAQNSGLNKQLSNLLINGNTNNNETGSPGANNTAVAALPIDKTVIRLEMISTYSSMQNLLDSLFTWEYLIGINSVEISDENGAGGNLRAKLEVEVYLKNKIM